MEDKTHVLLVLLCTVFAAMLVACGGTSEHVAVEGLASPRGLTALDDGRLMVAEVGGGRLLVVDVDGEVTVLADLLPHTLEGPENAPSGVAAAVVDGDTTYFIVGEARAKGFREVYAIRPGDVPRGITGQDIAGALPPKPLLNPYDLVQLASGDLLVSDAGANVVWRVTLDGEISHYADPGAIAYDTSEGAGEAEPVPTGMTTGRDGAVYLATLTGAPFPTGGAKVFRMLDRNGDGDALDPGETTVYAEGFTTATDVAFLPDGSMLVTEYTTDMQSLAAVGFSRSAEYPGRLVRWERGQRSVVMEGLVSPTSVVALDGVAYVSEEYAGRVRAIEP